MIKKLAVLFLSVASLSAMAQDAPEPLKSKRGELILPQTGEWGLGIDATPFLEYFGNFFHGEDYNNAPSFNSPDNLALIGKYMKDNNTAYRVRFALNRSSETGKNLVFDDSNEDPEPKYVEDKVVASEINVLLGAGLEKRRGNGRLQGIYGAEVAIGISSAKNKYDYGNSFDEDDNGNNPTFTVWDGVFADFVTNDSERVTEEKSGTQFGFGVNGFIGVEYFIAPKISLGGEVGYGINLRTNPKGETSVQYFDFVDDELETETTESYNSTGSFDIGTNTFGSINLIFYF
ncbi:MAG TPA: hypothetical protein VGK59_17985 [Ohtaekwangia sp.]